MPNARKNTKTVKKSCKWCGEDLLPENTRYECNPCRSMRDYQRRKAKKELEKEQEEVIPKGESIEGDIEEKMNYDMLVNYFRNDRKTIYKLVNTIPYYDNKIKELEKQISKLNLTVSFLSKPGNISTPPPSPTISVKSSDSFFKVKTPLKTPPKTQLKTQEKIMFKPKSQVKTPVKSPPKPILNLKAKTPVKSPPKPILNLKAKTPVKSPPKPILNLKVKTPVKSPPKPKIKTPTKSPPKPKAKTPVKSPPKPKAKTPVKSPPKPKIKTPTKSPPKPKAKTPVKSPIKLKIKTQVKKSSSPKFFSSFSNKKFKDTESVKTPVYQNKFKPRISSPLDYQPNFKRKYEI